MKHVEKPGIRIEEAKPIFKLTGAKSRSPTPGVPPRPILSSRSSSVSNPDILTDGDLTYCRISCHCKLSDMRVVFRTAALPIHSYICHCNTCRHNTGQMGFYTVKIEGPPLEVDSDDRVNVEILQKYEPADQPGVVRYFCPTCSAMVLASVDRLRNREGVGIAERQHYFAEDVEETPSGQVVSRVDEVVGDTEEWRVAGGALRVSYGIIQPMYHLHVASTLDGGLADHLRVIEGRTLLRFSEGPGSAQLPVGWRSPELEGKEVKELSLYCHCGAISVKLARPEEIARAPQAPYPDLIYPRDVTLRAKQRNPEDEKWWIRPAHHEGGKLARYLAGHCACSFCRTSSGFEFQPWGYVARAHLHEADKPKDEPLDLFHEEFRPKGLKQYVSSPGRYREFCGTCGATAFWWNAGRPDIVLISMGLVDEKLDGVRAEHWFSWHRERVSHMEMAMAPHMVQGLQEGLKSAPAH